MSAKQILPKFGSIRFNCPHCGALAHQYWGEVRSKWLDKDEAPKRFGIEELRQAKLIQESLPKEQRYSDYHKFDEYLRMAMGEVFSSQVREDPYSYQIYQLDVSRCDSCSNVSIWLNEKLTFPSVGPAVFANEDMPHPVKRLFDEAGAVFGTSPKSSAALLRLALQVLLKELGQKGKDINADINALYDDGLSPNLAKVMHSLRIIGNESVHPGVISVDDDPAIAEAMFRLINEIVEQLITRPREQKELWEMLPEGKRKPVEKKLGEKEIE